MLFVLCNWLYIFITTFLTGFGVLYVVEKKFSYKCKRLDAYLVAGLVILTAYAQWFSLFYRVNIEANIILVVVCGLIVVCLRKELVIYIKDAWKLASKGQRIGIFILVIVVCYFTSRGHFVYDTNLYHAQAIRWLEEYGIVKGLANIQSRAAYNSSAFCLSALYSMKYVFGQSMHGLQGFMALILASMCLSLGKVLKEKKVVLSDFAKIGAVYYLSLLYDEITSPSSDYAVMIILFYIVIKWLELLEKKEVSSVPYSLLCVAGVYTVTLKLTAGLILILLIKPVIMLLKEKKWQEIWVYLLMGTLVIAPYLARNVIISGWLLYPFEHLDLFNVDWKVPEMLVSADAYQIKIWGKGIHDYEGYGNVAVWFPNWFRTVLTFTEKLLILADIVALAILGVSLIVQVIKPKKEEWDNFLVFTTVAASYLFWQFSAPLTRYGYAYILLLSMLVFGWYYRKLFSEKKPYVVVVAMLILFLWKGYVLVQGALTTYLWPCYVKQVEYESNEGEEYVKPFELNGHIFYYRASGYHKLPGGGLMFDMRGDKIEDGFKFAEKYEGSVFGVNR
ncbi:MAG: hypothetical protein E7299_07275 [Lachnospiraceae bacterium]|nr:hypothetical protein [Lachnospiraceae bacterium]